MRGVVAMVLALCAVGCGSATGVGPAPASIYRLDRDGFIQELVYSRATPRTPLFDDYTEGSYHVDKADLIEGIRERRKAGTPILAAVVTGPELPMWSYDVALFLRGDDGVQVNTVEMPHARITSKATSQIAEQELNAMLAAIRTSELIAEGMPSAGGDAKEREWSYDLLVADWTGDVEHIFRTTAMRDVTKEPSAAHVALFEALSDAIDGGLVTWAHDVSDEESVYRDVKP